MPRKLQEWVGKTDDAKVPPRVRLRIWNRENGICHLTRRKIMPSEPWELDHRIALINGGRHAESNLFPALKDKHGEKTKEDVAEKSKVAAIAKAHIGAKSEPTRPIAHRPKPEKTQREPAQGMPEIARRFRRVS